MPTCASSVSRDATRLTDRVWFHSETADTQRWASSARRRRIQESLTIRSRTSVARARLVIVPTAIVASRLVLAAWERLMQVGKSLGRVASMELEVAAIS